MKEECDKEYGINSILLTKPILRQKDFKDFKVSTPIHILYTGKLVIGREHTIVKVVDAIKQINTNGQKVILDVYTQTKLPKKLRKQIDVPGCCILHEPVKQSEVIQLQKEADVLLFAESLSRSNLTARLSFSTKLTDYFSAGKCVWGIGNADLGPIDYIKTENSGFVSTSDREILEVLNEMVKNPQLICDKAKLGYECGVRNHNKDRVINTLLNVIRC